MKQNNLQVRKRPGEVDCVLHLAGKYLQLKHQSTIPYFGEPPTPGRVAHPVRARREAILRVRMPVELLTDASQKRALHLRIEQIGHPRIGQAGAAHDRVGKAHLIRDRLHPANFSQLAACRPVGLDVHRAGDPGQAAISEKFGRQVVAANGLIGTEDSWHGRTVQPRQIGAAPKMVVGVNDR